MHLMVNINTINVLSRNAQTLTLTASRDDGISGHSKYLVVILLPVHVREKTQTKLVFPRGSQAKTSWAVTCPTDTWAHVGRYRCDGVDEDLAAG